MNLEAYDWLMKAGKEKWSIFYSPCAQYGVITSNNVKSINSALCGIRKLPVLDCLMALERYVGSKWAENAQKTSGWKELT